MGLRVLGGGGASIEYASAGSNSSSPLNTLTVAGAALGTEAPTRRNVILVRGRNANLSTVGNVNSVTVGGVSATKVYETPAAISHWTIWITPETQGGGPSGPTGDIVINRSVGNGFNFVGFACFAAYRLRSASPHDTDTADGDPAAMTVDKPTLGVVASMAHRSATDAFTWAGVTEAVDQTAGVGAAERISGALSNEKPSQLGLAVEADTAASCSAVAATFR